MSAYTYCSEYETGCLHIDKAYAVIRKMFGQRLKTLQYRYALADGSKRGGIHVQGKVAKLNSLALFGEPPHGDALGPKCDIIRGNWICS